MSRPICRPPIVEEYGVSDHEFKCLDVAFTDANHWIEPPEFVKTLFLKFKGAIKQHFYFQQARKCCYCCIELSLDHGAFTLDHVVARSIGVQFILQVKNMGVCCRPCNSKKTDHRALSAEIDVSVLTAIPEKSSDYVIVHPQLDSWDENLKFDFIRRILPVTDKGRETISACGLERINALRVSDVFAADSRASVYKATLNIMRYKQSARRKSAADVLRAAAVLTGSSRASAIADQIAAEFE